ncbi:hypothetical protein HDU82_002411 [Entophlyctis luteolus]|nr:hypothetical protein HDU82_002411 [Entophlyctis luteolus]
MPAFSPARPKATPVEQSTQTPATPLLFSASASAALNKDPLDFTNHLVASGAHTATPLPSASTTINVESFSLSPMNVKPASDNMSDIEVAIANIGMSVVSQNDDGASAVWNIMQFLLALHLLPLGYWLYTLWRRRGVKDIEYVFRSMSYFIKFLITVNARLMRKSDFRNLRQLRRLVNGRSL